MRTSVGIVLVVCLFLSCAVIPEPTPSTLVARRHREINRLCEKHWQIACIREAYVAGETIVVHTSQKVADITGFEFPEMVGYVMGRDTGEFFESGLRDVALYVDNMFFDSFRIYPEEDY